ncbi:MAG TPA: hydrolase [Selenomonadales bacterium]|nr:hydrolase [Selenomonadales bacterium]
MRLVIENSNQKMLEPAVLDGVTWETTRKGAPGKLTFQVVKDDLLDFQEGNPVRMWHGENAVFKGFVFTKKRNKDDVITVTAYDQLRYLKNKDIYCYTNLKASDVVTNLAADFQLQVGEVEDTGYVIPKYRGSNETLFDIIQSALDHTLQNKKKMYVLYDDFGKLMLKDIDNLHVEILLDAETAEDFDYESSIDKETYNKIKLYYDNKDEGKRDVYISQDSSTQAAWGILQLCESINLKKALNPVHKADTLLSLYNRVRRSLSITNAVGDNRVRAGSGVMVNLNLGDISMDGKWMLVETAKHRYSNNIHTMDLTLRGGLIG